jgi:hypothetical protein
LKCCTLRSVPGVRYYGVIRLIPRATHVHLQAFWGSRPCHPKNDPTLGALPEPSVYLPLSETRGTAIGTEVPSTKLTHLNLCFEAQHRPPWTITCECLWVVASGALGWPPACKRLLPVAQWCTRTRPTRPAGKGASTQGVCGRTRPATHTPETQVSTHILPNRRQPGADLLQTYLLLSALANLGSDCRSSRTNP